MPNRWNDNFIKISKSARFMPDKTYSAARPSLPDTPHRHLEKLVAKYGVYPEEDPENFNITFNPTHGLT